jgi:hypothetical protein
MPRVIVTTDAHRPEPSASVLLDEQVASIHLGDGHAAAQLIERLAWAIDDAEQIEQRPRARSRSVVAVPEPAAIAA